MKLRARVVRGVVLVRFDNRVMPFIFRFWWMDARVWDPKPFGSSSVVESGEVQPGSVRTKQGTDYRSVVSLCFCCPAGIGLSELTSLF